MQIREEFLRATTLFLAAALLACDAEEVSGVARKADASPAPEIETVVLFSIDSLRADRLGVYGHSAPTSPTLDRLATEGLLFNNAYSTTSWTLPSHAAMLSGLDDYAHGAYQALSPISNGVMTLAERLEKVGTRSTGFFAGPFLHPTYGFARGFDQYIDATSYGWKAKGEPDNNIPHEASHKDVTNPLVLEKVRVWLDNEEKIRRNGTSNGPRRSFVFIHLWDVHYDYIPPQEYLELFDPDYTGTLDGRDFLDNPRIRPDMPERDLQHLLALYDAEIRYTDDTIAQILELFDAHGLLERSAVIVTADHGEEFFDHGRTGHGLTLHEEVLRVPLILWLPGRRPVRSTSEKVTSHIDIAPTVCDLLAVDCDYDGIGDSFMPDYLEQNPSARRQDALAELTNPFLKLDLTARIDSKGKTLRDNRTGRLFYSPNSGRALRPKSVELNERTLGSYPPAVRTAASRLRERSTEAKDLGAKIIRGEEAHATPIDPHTLEQLEALGYLTSDTPGKHLPGVMSGTDSSPPKTLPNVVLIISDDQSWSDFGFMGSEIAQTPNIDALAAGGVRFSLAFNTGNVCRPSLRSILTGYHPAQYRARVSDLRQSGGERSKPPYIRQVETLPRLLAKRGYVSFEGGKYWEGDYKDAGFTQGLTRRDSDPRSNEKSIVHPVAKENAKLGRFNESSLLREAGGAGLELGRSTMDPLFQFIDENRDRPFFVWFAPMLPHIPFDASESERAPYEAAGLSESAIGYYANIARLDRRVGELIAHLEKHDLIEETLIVFLSDNGWEVGPPGDFQQQIMGGANGKRSIHERAFRTPLIMSWPSQIVPRVDDRHLISTIDLFATLLDFAEIDLPSDRWGKSLEPLLTRSGPFTREKVMAEVKQLRTPPGGKFPFTEKQEALFLRTRNWRYVSVPGRETNALYSMAEDPEETMNVCAKNPEICDRMRYELEAWQSKMNASPPISRGGD